MLIPALIYAAVFALLSGVFLAASRTEPTPFIGVWTGYTMSSRRVWRRANMLAALLFALAGVATVILTLFNEAVGLAAVVTSPILVLLVVLEYGRRLWEQEQVSKPIPGGVERSIALSKKAKSVITVAVATVTLCVMIPSVLNPAPIIDVIAYSMLLDAWILAYISLFRTEVYHPPNLPYKVSNLAAATTPTLIASAAAGLSLSRYTPDVLTIPIYATILAMLALVLTARSTTASETHTASSRCCR